MQSEHSIIDAFFIIMWSATTEERSNLRGGWDPQHPHIVSVESSSHSLLHQGTDEDFERLLLPGDEEIKVMDFPVQWFRPNQNFSNAYTVPDPSFNSNLVTCIKNKESTLVEAAKILRSDVASFVQQLCCVDLGCTRVQAAIKGNSKNDYAGDTTSFSPAADFRLTEDIQDIVLDDEDRRELRTLFSSLVEPEDCSSAPSFMIDSTTTTTRTTNNGDHSTNSSFGENPIVRGDLQMLDHVSPLMIPAIHVVRAVHESSTCSSTTKFPCPLTKMLTGSRCVSQASIDQRYSPHGEVADVMSLSLENTMSSRFRNYQEDQWMMQYGELKEFVEETGYTFVPSGYPARDSLARWTKRQRYQFKLRLAGKVSTMTDDRVTLLDDLGFIWNSQIAVWEKRLQELKEFKRDMRHCNVPSHYTPNQKLATWVKVCDRVDSSFPFCSY